VFIVISRVVSADSKTSEPVVERKKIIPDFDLVKSLDSNDFVFNCRSRSEEPKLNTDYKMDHLENSSVPTTEYQQSYTWNKAMVQNNPHVGETVSIFDF